MYRNIKAAMVHLVESFGFDIKVDQQSSKELYWSNLYCQGAGVAFNASIEDDKARNFVRELALEGRLSDAMECVRLLDEGELRFSIVHSDNHYTHEETMSVEIDGPHGEVSDDVPEFIDKVGERIIEAAKTASMKAHDLLHDLFLLPINEEEVVRRYTTKHWLVEFVKSPFSDDSCDEDECFNEGDAADTLEQIRYLVDPSRKIEMFAIQVRISYREEDDEFDEWEEVHSEFIHCYAHDARNKKELLGEFRALASEAIEEARKQHQPATEEPQKEAA